jgi:hypothetical protein
MWYRRNGDRNLRIINIRPKYDLKVCEDGVLIHLLTFWALSNVFLAYFPYFEKIKAGL